MPQDPRLRVFRYMSAGGVIHTLKDRRLRFAAPKTFNDPFDCQWNLFWQHKDTEWMGRCINGCVDAVLNGRFADADFADAQARNEFYKTRTAVFAHDDPPAMARQIIGIAHQWNLDGRARARFEQVARQADRFRVMCCTTNPCSMSMWTHYAKEHGGFVLELCPELLNLPEGAILEPVRYCNSAPEVFGVDENVRMFTLGHSPDPRNLARHWVLSKAASWSYEEEFRIMYTEDGPAAEGTHSYVTFRPGAIASIIGGAQVSHADLQQVSELCRACETPIPVKRVRPRFNMFELEVV